MGYLRRKLRRSTARAAASAFSATCAGNPAADPPTVGFVRLATAAGAGVFSAGYRLRDGQRGTPAEQAELTAVLRWFERELPPHGPAEPAAVFWFKADTTELIRQVWRLVRLLQRNGQDVRICTTRRPGRVVFEDRFQVAAVPYRDARFGGKQLPAAV